MQNKNFSKFNFLELKFKVFILNSINKDILKKFRNWTDKYQNFIEYKRIDDQNKYRENYDNYLIAKDDIKYFTNLKKKFKKYINASLKVREQEIIYLNDNKILDYKYKDSENKIRPYYINDPNTKSNHKVVIYQISSKERTSLKKIEINNHTCYLNSEEPITVNKFKLFKNIIESDFNRKKIKIWCESEKNMKYTLITGASAGIGKALAEKFAKEGHNLIIVARREQLLNKLKDDLENKYKVKVIVYKCDLSNSQNVITFYNDIKKYPIEIFINNAGMGDMNLVWESDLAKTEKILDLNIKALTLLSMMFIKDNLDKDVQLINVSSVVGYNLFSAALTYSASKFFVSAWTEGVARQLQKLNKKIKVKVLAPAATESEFEQIAFKDSKIESATKEKIRHQKDRKQAQELAEEAYQLCKNDHILAIVKDNKLNFTDGKYQDIIWV
ncbi:MAG: hypothetical protein HPPSJP_2080 [Candidatus Hepatoplasma scabrum]|nr:MAG: hypothetical protein HPPSJP_2080 [Candidatus Hepatoplasma sp.]